MDTRITFVVSVLVTAAALVWTEENWRATRDWAACQQDMAARGERLDLTAAYDPLPPERNLARAPFFTHAFKYTVDDDGRVTFPLGARQQMPHLDYMPWPAQERTAAGGSVPLSGIYRGDRVDLRAWQASYRQYASDFGLAPFRRRRAAARTRRRCAARAGNLRSGAGRRGAFRRDDAGGGLRLGTGVL